MDEAHIEAQLSDLFRVISGDRAAAGCGYTLSR